MPKVSFVVTVYNKAPFLPGVITALKNQTGAFEAEYVFINDGSSDNSWEVVKAETAGLSNVVLVEQVNQGVAIATNNAVAAATGDYIKLVDSDDILAPFCTDLLLKTMQSTDSDFVFAISGEYEETATFDPVENPEIVEFPDPLYSVIDRGFARVSHCLFKKSLFDKAGGCDARIFSQDHSLFIRLSSHGKLTQVREIVCASPKDEPGRIMNNQAQVIHDATLALAYHVQDFSEMTPRQLKAAQNKVISRVWKWAKNTHGQSIFSLEFLLYLLSKCGGDLSAQQLVSLCGVFRKNATVRRPEVC